MAYTANPVNFDGANDYLIRGADLTGAADSKLWTGSAWVRRTSTGAEANIFFGINIAYQVRFTAGNLLQVFAENAAGTTILSFTSTQTITDTNWHHILWSSDQTDSGKIRLYIDDLAETAASVTCTDDLIDFTITDHSVGARTNAANKFAGDMADPQMWFGVWSELATTSNRRNFISNDGAPIDPATAAAALGPPIVALYGDTVDWHTNKGTGEGFTEVGALTDGGVPLPSSRKLILTRPV